jgi:threonine dehydratase
VAVKALRPDVRIDRRAGRGRRVVPALAGRRRRPLKLPTCATIADGINVLRPGELTFAHVSKLVDDIVTVTDEDLSAALLVLLERHKMVVEPAGGAAVAALLTGACVPAPTGPVVAILSGGNIDPMLLLRVIEHGLTSAGRFPAARGALRRPAG